MAQKNAPHRPEEGGDSEEDDSEKIYDIGVKRSKILESSSDFLKGLDTIKIGGNVLRINQKIAALGFKQWLENGLEEEKLMGHVIQPTGSGKTTVAVLLSQMVKGRSVIVAHSNADEIAKAFEKHEESKEQGKRAVGRCFGNAQDISSPITVTHFMASKDWLSEMDWNSVDLVVIDEADVNALSATRASALNHLAEIYGIPIVAMSATQEQASGKKLETIFPHEISRLNTPDSLPECLDMGIIPELVFSDLYLDMEFTPDEQQLGAEGDFSDEDTDAFINTNPWIQGILEHYRSNFTTDDLLTPGVVVFRNNTLVEECLKQAKKMGIRAAAYTGKASDTERDAMRKAIQGGDLDLLVGSRLIGRSLHLPRLGVVYNSTLSRSPQIFWQANGRAISVGEENDGKRSHIIAVLPKNIRDKRSGAPLPPERRPFCHRAFFDPTYFQGDEAEGDFQSYELKELDEILSVDEVSQITREMRGEVEGFQYRGAVVAEFLGSLEGEVNIKLIRQLMNLSAPAIIQWTKALQQGCKGEADGMANKSIEFLESAVKSMPDSDEGQLLKDLAAGKKDALEMVIRTNLPLMMAMAKKLAPDDIDPNDLINGTIEGLLPLFKKKRFYRSGLCNYLLIACFHGMTRVAHENAKVVWVPEYIWDIGRRIAITRERIGGELRKGTLKDMKAWEEIEKHEAMKSLGLSKVNSDVYYGALEMLRRVQAEIHESVTSGPGPSEDQIIEFLGIRDAQIKMEALRMKQVPFREEEWESDEPSPFKNLDTKEIQALMLSAMKSLTVMESWILKWRFGLEGDELTLKEIGGKVNLSGERVRSLQNQAKIKLEKALSYRIWGDRYNRKKEDEGGVVK